jgi:hypothetical protein
LSGYGITDASLSSHTHTFASLTSKPTTLSGYGITDAYTQLETNNIIDGRITTIIGTAPSNLDTLQEIATQLSTDESAVSALVTTVSGKLAKASNLSDLLDISTARSNLELGSFALLNSLAFSSLTSKPTTISGYGISDAFTQSAADSLYSAIGHTHTFASLTFKPTTRAGYGITDAEPTIVADLSTKFWDGTKTFRLLSAADIPDISSTYLTPSAGDAKYRPITYVPTFASITSKPTTLSGYGITDAESAITPTLNTQFWDGTKTFRALLASDIPDISASYLNQAAGDLRYSLLGHTHSFASLTSKPTTISGYGISDAFTQTAADLLYRPIGYVPAFSAITGKPTTITGYGIVDAFTQITADGLYSPLGHTHTFTSLTDKPTTISGFGITDAYTKTEINTSLSLLAPLASPTFTGTVDAPIYNISGSPFSAPLILTLSSSNVVLTSSQIAKKLIVLRGTLSANINITAPDVLFSTTFINETTGSYTITIKRASTTGTTIAAAETLNVYYDGL